jgi:predicted transcriptional regulator YdeE
MHRWPKEGHKRTAGSDDEDGEIYREWLPQSGYRHAEIADIELYDQRFDCESPTLEIEYGTSVIPKGR